MADLYARLSHAMGMSDAVRDRHGHPWSGWICLLIVPTALEPPIHDLWPRDPGWTFSGVALMLHRELRFLDRMVVTIQDPAGSDPGRSLEHPHLPGEQV